MKFSIKAFFSKCDQIRRKRRIWSHLLKKSLMKNFVVCAVLVMNYFYLFLCIKCYKFLNFYAINLHQVIYTTKHYESQSFLKSQPYLPKACLRKFFWLWFDITLFSKRTSSNKHVFRAKNNFYDPFEALFYMRETFSARIKFAKGY